MAQQPPVPPGPSAVPPPPAVTARPFEPQAHADTAASGAPPVIADRPTSRLAATLLPQLEGLTDRVVHRIHEGVPGYVRGEVPRDDLWWSVRANIGVLVTILAEDRELTDEEVTARAALGARRARQQLPVAEVIQAFQVGYIEVWAVLTEVARRAGQDAVDDLVEVAGHFWAMMHQVSAAVAGGYHETSREEGGRLRRRGLAFLDLLHGLPGTAAAAREEAHALGLDPDAPLVAALRGHVADDDPLRHRDAGVVLIERADEVVLLADGSEGTEVFDDEPGPLGIGLARPGLEGLRASMADAQQALDAARALGRDVVRFDEDWFACLLVDHLDRLRPLVADAAALLAADEESAQTVRAYLDADGHLGAAGRALHVHANTVAYRLERVAERTGLDPRRRAAHLDVALALLLARRGSG